MKLIFLRKFINSFLYPKFLYTIFIDNSAYEEMFEKKLTRRLLKKIIYFYPSISDSYSWLHGGINEWRNPKDFVKLRLGLDDVFIDYFERHIDKKDKILDLGCNSGRHLNELYKKDYKKLHGVDIMNSALLLFEREFPKTFMNVKIEKDFIQRNLLKTTHYFYDTLYTIGATIELIHPSFDIIGQMCRVVKKNIIILIQPNAHNYPRFYVYEFSKYGFNVIEEKKLGKDHCLFHFVRDNV